LSSANVLAAKAPVPSATVTSDSKPTCKSDLEIISSSTEETFNGTPRQMPGVV